MNLSLREIKRRARVFMKSSAKPNPFTVALVFTVVTMAVSFFFGRIAGAEAVIDNARMEELSQMAQAGHMPSFAEFAEAVEIREPESDFVSELLELGLRVVSVMVTAGFGLYALRLVRGQNGEMGNLLDGFGQFYRVIMVYLLKTLFIALGTICFIIPGIRLAYGYRLANYLLWDHPDWTPMQCLRNSRLMMNGRRWTVFTMDVSFVFWLILGSLPFTVANFSLNQQMYGSLLAALAAGCAISAFVSLYRELTLSTWYNLILGTIPETEEKPPWEY